jgi:hypothetical protein
MKPTAAGLKIFCSRAAEDQLADDHAKEGADDDDEVDEARRDSSPGLASASRR